ncbi:sensor histidine kinase [Azospirillum rugosum]|uniref:histidine kinase n=1 Tax=Azospirillum rugosum TaxID=416170 RepID=A0ABS4SH26_9PROT|nr:HAMP domain-containing sensor histidine kinase [Azospirillum rugosum]MBP2291868.1 signal transduction histidine kinase [Azospirillum rugosum]MDQ0524320.1 signal transduction histidine kinase [Azospirillum rugosum]
MVASAALVTAMGLCALGGAGLATLVWRHGRALPGTRPLAGFLLLVGGWSVGLLIPGRLGAALMALAPLGGALFVHFAAALTGRSGPTIRRAYAAGAVAALLALLGGTGRFVPWPLVGPGVDALFRYEGAGLVAGAATMVLAAVGHWMLLGAWRTAEGVERRQLTLVLLSSGLGLLSVGGLAFPVLGIEAYPWPLLLLPLYLAVLAYAVLRYRLMAVNRWAVRAVCWGLLIALAALVSASSAGIAAERAGAPFLWTAAALLGGLALAGPLRRLADRIVYPGGEVTADDLARWRRELQEAGDKAALTATAERLLRERLALTDGAAPERLDAIDLDRAPPGPRRVAGVLAELAAQAQADLDRRRSFAERQRLAELGALAATVAHDLRNPMNIVAMAVADAAPETRGEVRTQLGRMDALVRDLLDYAKPWRVEATDVDLADTLAQLGGEVATDIPPGLSLRADAGRLKQALANLLDNARAAGGRVLLTAERRPDGVVVDVCDDGPGIPEEIRASLFQPFVSRSPGGTGLGLAIVAKVMAAHGGSVSLAERPGWPTCVRLRFPS